MGSQTILGRTGTSHLVAESRHCAAVPDTVNDRRGVFHRIRDPIGDPSAIWVAQVTMTERDEQPLPAGYNLRVTMTRRLFPRLSGRRSPSADLPVRSCYRATRCEPGCPRRNAGIGRPAVPVRGARLRGVSGVITYPWNARGLVGVLCLSLGPGLLAGGVVGRVHRDVRRPLVKTGAAQVAAPT